MKCGTMNIKERNQRSLITIFDKFIKERNKVFLVFLGLLYCCVILHFEKLVDNLNNRIQNVREDTKYIFIKIC